MIDIPQAVTGAAINVAAKKVGGGGMYAALGLTPRSAATAGPATNAPSDTAASNSFFIGRIPHFL